MQLQKVHVTNYRSIDDSEEFTVEHVTCLVGKNEAGKSAILLALASLNPHSATPAVFDKERDYPRRLLTQYDTRHKTEDAIAISTGWRLTEGELALIAASVGIGAITNDAVTVSRKYGHGIEVETSINFSAALEHLYTKFLLDQSERSVLSAVTNTSELIDALAKLSSPSAQHEQLKAYLAKHGTVTAQVKGLITAALPKFMYFAAYDRMDGAIQLDQTRQMIANGSINQDGNRGNVFLLSSSTTWGFYQRDHPGDHLRDFNARLQAASNNITDQVLEYWTQNPDLSVAVRVEQARPGDPVPLNTGTVAWARINNQLHRVDTPFSERSAGFVWFFSFLVKFAQVKDEITPVVLLLDEPGLTLHGKAQPICFASSKKNSHHTIR